MNHKELIKNLEKNKNILAIGIQGSFGYGYQDKYSDVDLFLVVENDYSIPKLIKELKKENIEIHPHPEILKNLNSFSLKTKDRRVDIELISKDNFNNVITEDLKKLFDPLKILQKSKIKKLSKKDFECQYRMITYPLRIKTHFKLCNARKNPLFLYNLIHSCVEILVKIIYALNKKEYICLKWAANDFKKFNKKPKNFEKRINRIISLGNKGKELEIKIEKIHELGKETYDLIFKDFPEIKKIKAHVNWIDK